MKSKVAIIKTEECEYPVGDAFRPSQMYPEYIYKDDISEKENHVYDMVRQGLCRMGFDKSHYGTEEWNPLGELIEPGDIVLIKPNLVMHKNLANLGTDCLYTHPSVVAPIIDYAIKALNGKGEIIVGDAPMQECDFGQLISESHYQELIEFYQSKTTVKISLCDFRDLRSELKNGMYHSVLSEVESGRIIDLKTESEFAEKDEEYFEKIRITNYDPDMLKRHHNVDKHEYCVNEKVLMADVIINMPKPKTHRKAGVTIGLKNLVGVSARKEYLPHHTNGSKKEGGDEYLNTLKLKGIRDCMLDKKNYYMQTKKNYKFTWLLQKMIAVINRVIKVVEKDDYYEGSWYGNDTICRTIVDLNKIIFYADKEGVMCNYKNKKYLVIADMIVSGEKEGPLLPSPKKVGIIAIGTNPVCFDEAIATIMGAKLEYISTICRARNTKSKYKLVVENEKAFLISNDERWNEKYIEDLCEEDLIIFEPSSGWIEGFRENTK